jgi:hypothetical protein
MEFEPKLHRNGATETQATLSFSVFTPPESIKSISNYHHTSDWEGTPL